MIPFIESNDVLDDPPRLRKRLRDHGYLFIRGLLPNDEVIDLRRKFLELCSEAGWLRPGSELMDGLTDHRPIMEGEPEYSGVYAKIQSQESFHRLKFNESILSVMEDIFQEPVVPLPQTIGRIAFPRDNQRGTHPHQDWIFVGGSTEAISLWAPLGDVPPEVGGLKILDGSHKSGFLEPRLADGPGHRVVDTDPELEWHQSGFRCGDVLIFKMFTVHGAAENLTPDKLRLSGDFRYVGTSHVINEEWLDPHSSGPDKAPYTWTNLQREWQDSPIADYWKSWENAKTRPHPRFWETPEG